MSQFAFIVSLIMMDVEMDLYQNVKVSEYLCQIKLCGIFAVFI